MKRLTRTALVAALGLAASAAAQAAAPDWSKVSGFDAVAFYPGTSSIEWITTGPKHGGARGLKVGERCTGCHADEAEDVGKLIVSGGKNEPQPIKGKVGSIPVKVQASHDGTSLYLRFSWAQPAGGAAKMDAENQTKLAVMFPAANLARADQSGCWEACHGDARTMPGAKGPDATKYVTGADLAGGIYYDLVQWTSSGKSHDGHVADKRVMDGGKALVEAKGELVNGQWTVTFVRKLAGAAPGDVTMQVGKTYPFGFAIHDDHAAGRFHHVSFDIHLGIDAEGDVVAKKM